MRLPRPSNASANALAVIALFLALGGAAYAGAKLKANSVGSKQVRDDSLVGTDISEDSLGRVPSAASAATAGDAGSVDGLDSSDLARRGIDWQPLPAAHQSGNPPGRFRCQHSDGVVCDRYFRNAGAPFAGAEIGLDDFGMTHLAGTIELEDSAFEPVAPQPVFTLPAAMRPSATRSFLVLRNGGDDPPVALNVEADGDVWLAGDAADGDTWSLDGVAFAAG